MLPGGKEKRTAEYGRAQTKRYVAEVRFRAARRCGFLHATRSAPLAPFAPREIEPRATLLPPWPGGEPA
jgi:hypothetical protein